MTVSGVIFLFYFLPATLGGAYALQALAAVRRGPSGGAPASTLWLIAASVVFYGWSEPHLLGLLLGSAAVNFCAGLLIRRLEGASRRSALVAGLAANLGLLGWFKYSGLMAAATVRLAAFLGFQAPGSLVGFSVALPLGISFYTFHGISYIMDVYRGVIPAERRPLAFGLYYTLFPQLVAGPIVRYAEIAADLTVRRISLEDVYAGMRRFAIGLAKKTLIANQVALIADGVFGLDPANLTAAAAWIGVAAYSLQIYFDFSGYSDMAIGIGRALGFRFPENFEHPYTAISVRDFWRRWHMTLTRWFRDYLYFPLGGNRRGAARQAANLFIVFSLCGLWHGASWTFLGWGLFHGFFLSVERLAQKKPIPGGRLLGHAYTLAVVGFGWVLFRSGSWHQTVSLWRAMLDLSTLGDWRAVPWQTLTGDVALAFAAGLVASTGIGSKLRGRLLAASRPLQSAAGLAESAAIVVLFGLSLLSVGAGSHNPFIYYRF